MKKVQKHNDVQNIQTFQGNQEQEGTLCNRLVFIGWSKEKSLINKKDVVHLSLAYFVLA